MQGGKAEFLEQAEKRINDEELLRQYTQALERLTDVLDEELVFREYHPLQAELRNTAPGSVGEISAFAEMIETFESDPVFEEDILPRLNRPRQYPSARLELEIAHFIDNSGVSVEFVDPKAEEGEQQQDLLVKDSLPIEIKQLRQPSHMAEQIGYFNEISNAVRREGRPAEIKYAGRIYRGLAEPEKEEFINRIEEAVQRVKEGETAEIRESSLGALDYEMFLAPPKKEDELKKWMEEHDVSRALSGPPQTKDDILRLRRSIEEKVEQLPDGTSGVVLIEVDAWIPKEDRGEELLGLARELLKDIYDHAQLLSVVLLIRSSFLDPDALNISKENVRVADFETHSDIGFRTFVTIHNRFAEDTSGKDLVDSIFSGS